MLLSPLNDGCAATLMRGKIAQKMFYSLCGHIVVALKRCRDSANGERETVRFSEHAVYYQRLYMARLACSRHPLREFFVSRLQVLENRSKSISRKHCVEAILV